MAGHQDPYVTLGLSPDADEEAIRQRYLRLVRENPPEREPAKFAEIRAAYDLVRSPEVAWSHRLFGLRSGQSLDELLHSFSAEIMSQRFPTDLLLSLGDK